MGPRPLQLLIANAPYAGTLYHKAPDGERAVRLTKQAPPRTGDAYDVWRDRHGYHCTCPSHTFRHEGLDARGCKHCVAVAAAGLLDEPTLDTVSSPAGTEPPC